MESVNWLAVIAAAAAGFFIGGVWYGPIFGKAWMTAADMTDAKIKAGNPALIYGLTFFLNIIAAISLVMLLGPERTLQTGLFYGAIAGVTFVSTALGITYLFERRPLSQFLINAGYQTVNFATMGVILGAWR